MEKEEYISIQEAQYQPVDHVLLPKSQTYFFHYSLRGDTRSVTNRSGLEVKTFNYDAYGDIKQQTGSVYVPARFGGKYGYYSDENGSGFLLVGARWYSPELRRWLSRDPIEYDGGDNLYAYVRGNPVRYVDPSGEAPVWNKSDKTIPYKPEKEEQGRVQFCQPGGFCNVDGVYPPKGAPEQCKPVKIPDNCFSIIKNDGQLKSWCLPLPGNRFEPRALEPSDFSTEEFSNWSNPQDIFK